MIELYLAILLFGVGSYINSNKNMTDNTTNLNNNNIKDDTKLNNKIFEDSIKNIDKNIQKSNCTATVPRSFIDLLDEDTKELYSKTMRKEDKPKLDLNTETGEIISKLTGTKITKQEFMTNSQGAPMLPFFGSNVTQNTNTEGMQRRLETFTGTGDYKNKKKREQKPLFKPTKNLTNINGAPNTLDKELERYNKSNINNNVLPFQQFKVGPGVNDNGGRKGKGGFHQYEVQDIARSNYKSIDELNVKQQITYTEPVKAGKQLNEQPSSNPNVNKNRPEKAFAQNMDNQWKTPGSIVKMANRENFEAVDWGKKQSKQLMGSAAPAQNVKPTKIAIAQKSKRNTYTNSGLRNVKIVDSWTSDGEQADYGKKSFKATPTERETTQLKTHTSNLTTIVNALINPFKDIAKATRKQNTIGNARPTGNMSAAIPKKQTAYDPNDIARTTLKEQTIENNHTGHVSVASTSNKHKIYDYDTAPKITIRNTLEAVDYNANVNYNKGMGHTTNEYVAPATQKQFISDYEYSGAANSITDKPTTYDADYNASLNVNKEQIARGRKPMGSNVKVVNGKDTLTVAYNKQMAEVNAERVEKTMTYSKGPTNDNTVYSNLKVNLSNNQNTDRINPEILKVFNENPYTQPLTSYGAVEVV